MNLFSKLKKLDSESRHVKIGLIGAGKFATMYLAQIKKTPGIKLVAIADIQPDIAKENLKRVDWSEEEFSCNSIEDAIKNNKTFITEDYRKLIDHDDLELKIGEIINKDITQDYVRRNLLNINLKKKLKIAWDPGNGAMGTVMREISEKLTNSENIIINEDVDGNFPNHHPDPTVPKNMEQLIAAVINNKCDVGLAFDGDGDRLGVIDNLGNLVWADQYMLLLCREISKLYPSRVVPFVLKKHLRLFLQSKNL